MQKKQMRDLLVEFLKIKNKGWIKSLRKGTTGIGYTFETLLGKPEETFPIADFKGIEIKVKRKYSKGTITLFNAAPDNEVFATKRIYEMYSVQNRNKNYNKTFMVNVNAKTSTKYGYHKFKLVVDYDKEQVFLFIFNLEDILIENTVSWSFELIEQKINSKIKDLAIIKANIRKEDNIEYYNYYHIAFYEIKSLQIFLSLIEQGIISVTFKISVYTNGPKTGEMYNHGIGFDINEKNINELYALKDFEKKTTNSRS